MKRAVACLLAVCLCLQAPIGGLEARAERIQTSGLQNQEAVEPGQSGNVDSTNTTGTTDKSEQDESKPSQPETKPSQPETKPDQPETKPDQPEMKPDQPETNPDQSEIKPGQPETKPEQPESKPDQSESTPLLPGLKPEQPDTKPSQPEAGPDQSETVPDKLDQDRIEADLEKDVLDTTSAVGSVVVEIVPVLAQEGDSTLDVTLELINTTLPNYEYVESESINLTDNINLYAPAQYISFNSLVSGEYKLTVEGDGYVTFIQEIKVDSSAYKVMLVNDFSGYDFTKGKNHPGVLLLGNSEGNPFDEEDMENLVEAIHAESYDSQYDLDRDGQVTLVDLQYFSTFYKISGKLDTKASVVETAIVDSSKVTIASASNAKVGGDVADIFTDGDSFITIEPENVGEVTEDNPMELTIDLQQELKSEGMSIAPPAGSENKITGGLLTVTYMDGTTEKTETLPISEQVLKQRKARSSQPSGTVTIDADGTIVLNLGKQVAIKKVKLKITSTSGTSLAEIAKVEFLNDMEQRIPAPTMNIPENLNAEPESQSFTVTWKKAENVTAYEVEISYKGRVESIKTETNKLEVKQFNNDKLINNETYSVRVQSLNGDWKSGFCKSITATPKPATIPAPPEMVVITGGYKFLDISWKDMKDTDTYTLYYKKADNKLEEFQSISGLRDNSLTLTGLKEMTEYEIYLTGHNEIGDSAPSQHYKGKTTDMNPPVTPNYKLINTLEDGETVSSNIKSVLYPGDSEKPQNPFIVADGDYTTSWVRNDWDAGESYPPGKSPVVEFEDVYEMDTVVIIPDANQSYTYTDIRVYSWGEDNKSTQVPGRLSRKLSSNKNGKVYYEFQSSQPISPKKIQVNFSTSGGRRISIAELKFYHYDSLEYDVNALYQDDMHVVLKDTVNEDIITELRTRLDTPDEVSKEKHPKYDMLKRELDSAEKLLKDEGIAEVLQIDTSITKKADGAITFHGGLNAWQPLGVTALAGDKIVIYVGSPGKRTGDTTNLKLVQTQYNAESKSWFKSGIPLIAGPNEIDISAITSLDTEQGGQLYVEYLGMKSAETYSVRVSGGNSIPVLDITKASGSDAKKVLVKQYVEELEQYVPEIENAHNAAHKAGDSPRPFKNQECILGATDIVMDQMMYSVSAQQIWEGLSGSTDEKTEQLYQALTSMEDMMSLFYQHKGLSSDPAAGPKHQLPVSRQNIRYHRMFAGAFMYAGGLHIGIGWNSVKGLVGTEPVVSDAEGRYQSGEYLGWGIAHEIGHIIDEGAYEASEITNNYFSVLAQARETNSSVRFQYDEVYDKVTSGVIGKSSNVFTQLGMYWQLHLAYDKGGYNYKRYDNYDDQFDNLFFARVDSYVREPSKASKSKLIELTLDSDKDNNLMRLSIAAAQKNILEFFERWGMVPDAKTKAYASQFPKETRAIYLVNDEARDFEMTHGENGSVAATAEVTANLSYQSGTNEVKIDISSTSSNPDAMLGYEIYRSYWNKDKLIKEPVGFITADQTSYTDIIATVNNRAFTYEVIGYDKYLNPTPAVKTESVKVSHGGNESKESWSVTTNMVSANDQESSPSDPCAPVKTAIYDVIDDKNDTTYTGTASGEIPYIILNLNKEETITGLTYTLDGAGEPITNYKIKVSSDGTKWTDVKSGTFDFKNSVPAGKTQTVYFNSDKKIDGQVDDWLYTYDASYVKLEAVSQAGIPISVSELGIIGESGDNIEFYETNGIGILKEDYQAGSSENGTNAIIPKGSMIFTGTYKGNPAYNTVLMLDDKGNFVGGIDEDGDISASQMIFAKVPENGELGVTSDGTWIYYIEPQDMGNGFQQPKQIRAELYRVDDAHTSQGERLVSDTLFITVPDVLPEISIVNTADSMAGNQGE